MDKENKPTQSEESSDNTPVDLSALKDFNFGTNWTEVTRPSRSSGREGRGPSKGGARSERKDRRGFKPGSFRKSSPGGSQEGDRGGERGGDRPRRGTGDRPPRRGGDRREQRIEAPKKVVEVNFYPEDNAFKALCKALRTSFVTYELFDIARLILEKDERHYMIVRPLEVSHNPDDMGQQFLYVVNSSNLPFLHEDDANAVAANQCLDQFFDAETVEVEPPSGNFPTINKCGMTGELLGPPNYHRYRQLIVEHHAKKLPRVSFEKFESAIESVKDEAASAEWMEKMKTATHYKLKAEYGEQRVFEDSETARSYALDHFKGQLVKKVKSIRVEGTEAGRVTDPLIKANIDFTLDRQKRFPLDTANLLRGRLRRQKFALYKKGSKGVSYVCAVKRKFRAPGQSLSDNVQKLIGFIEEHPDLNIKDLRDQYLGFASSTEEGEEIKLTPEQETQVKGFAVNLQWLLREGYIAHYSDGRVAAHPPLAENKPSGPSEAVKATLKADAAEKKTAEAPDEAVKPAESEATEASNEATATAEEVTAPELASESKVEEAPSAEKVEAVAEVKTEVPVEEAPKAEDNTETEAAETEVEETLQAETPATEEVAKEETPPLEKAPKEEVPAAEEAPKEEEVSQVEEASKSEKPAPTEEAASEEDESKKDA